MENLIEKLESLPSSSGVYIFKDKNGKIIYVGKATSLKDRVSSYFQEKIGYIRPIEIMISKVTDFDIKKTDTVLEAYILEQNLIKKIQPKYNVDGKDDKSFSYVAITKENFPKFLILRKTELENENIKFKKIYGPYTSKKQIEIALKILRKIFPYHSKSQKTEKGCLDYQIGLCPGPYDNAISKSDYAKNILGIRMILEGKKKSLLTKMKKEMEICSEKDEFEKAAEMRNKIFALQHIQDIALISSGDKNFQFPICLIGRQVSNSQKNSKFRIEGYDISDISGKQSVGSMVVFDNSLGELQPNNSQYRKFKIKTVRGANDVASMEEVLARRFKNDWPRPNLILIDGGAAHLNAARRILKNYKIEIPLLAVAKGPTRKKLDIRTFGTVPEIPRNLVVQIRDEAHRFAIGYHRKLREKNFIK
jgi:excinuclease ABC subunit C